MVFIRNLPIYASDYKYIVANIVDGERWFWGAYDDVTMAGLAARELHDGVIYETGQIDND